MAAVILGPTGFNFNDQINFFLIDFQPGDEVRDESWIEPWGATLPTLAGYAVRKTQCTITLAIKGVSVAAVRTFAGQVRDQFNAQANRLYWSPGDGTKSFRTYPSPMRHPLQGQERGIYTLNSQFILEPWTFSVWRGPFQLEDSVIPIV